MTENRVQFIEALFYFYIVLGIKYINTNLITEEDSRLVHNNTYYVNIYNHICQLSIQEI